MSTNGVNAPCGCAVVTVSVPVPVDQAALALFGWSRIGIDKPLQAIGPERLAGEIAAAVRTCLDRECASMEEMIADPGDIAVLDWFRALVADLAAPGASMTAVPHKPS